MEGRKRVTDEADALAKQSRKGTDAPYSHAHVNETAIHREILRIYQLARAETRGVYDLGRDTERVEEENWVIRWMLWHVFRYRDNRNRNRRAPSNGGNSSNNNDDSDAEGNSPPERNKAASCESSCIVSNMHEHHLTIPADNTATGGTSRYWDPVRDE